MQVASHLHEVVLARSSRIRHERMTNANELRDMSDEQLELTLKEAKENLFRFHIQAQTDRLDAPSELRKHRRLVARVKTIQTERQKAATAQS